MYNKKKKINSLPALVLKNKRPLDKLTAALGKTCDILGEHVAFRQVQDQGKSKLKFIN
jgi:hypothetical protein